MQIIEVTEIDTTSSRQEHQDSIQQARRQLEICNACRYCESNCSVFPALHRQRVLSDSDINQLANLCHNCRGCHYACQYAAPHEFAINIPKILAEVRQNTWQINAVPEFLAKAFHHSGTAIALTVIAGFALLLWTIQASSSLPSASSLPSTTSLLSTTPPSASGFYSLLPHYAMIGIFMPAFLLPMVAILISLRKYWRSIGGTSVKISDIAAAIESVTSMKNLAGGHGEGCNFQDEDRFTNAQRWFHQATMYGFLLCFAATGTATLLHYLFNLPAPYDLVSLPKVLGITGGLLLSTGTLGLAYLKLKADRTLADQRVWGGEMAFIALLFFVSTTGLALYLFASSRWLPELLAIHLGSVLAFFLLMPFSKMVHGFYRLASLIRDEQLK